MMHGGTEEDHDASNPLTSTRSGTSSAGSRNQDDVCAGKAFCACGWEHDALISVASHFR